MTISPMLHIMRKAAIKAAKGMRRDFGEIEKLQISKKGVANFVTSADLRAERTLIDELQTSRPKFSFLTEESGEIEGADKTQRFVIDPIDGTTNFIHAIPYVCISLAAQKLNEKGVWETLAGVIYDPIHDECFMAEKNGGAFVNDYRLRVSQRKDDYLLSTSAPRKFRQDYESTLATFTRVTASGAVVRCSGSAALDLAYVAAGRLDGTWYNHLNVWDMAAGELMVREAGGTVSTPSGEALTGEAGGIFAASHHAYTSIKPLLVA
jgi:myo-inositol-1(or 4)-monophosphatase